MRIFSKLLIAALLPALVVIGLASALTYLNLQRGFLGYITTLESARLDPAIDRLARVYEEEGDFSALREDPRRWGALLSREGEPGAGVRRRPAPPRGTPPPSPSRQDPPPSPAPRRSIDPLELPHRVTLYDARGARLIGQGERSRDRIHKTVEVDGVRVATLGVRPPERIEDQLDIDYLAGQERALVLITALALGLGTFIALFLARSQATTIESLARGTRRLAEGDYGSRLEVGSADELGALARDLNGLAQGLESAERARLRWVADTSHELRTPLTVIRGELEAMQDGVRALDYDSLASLHREVLRLHRLVDDLALLASADRGALAYTMVPVDLHKLVADVVAQHRLRIDSAGLSVEVELDLAGEEVCGDPLRLTQLLANVLENSRRYTEPPGRVRVSSRAEDGALHVVVEDSAPGVDEEHRTMLFERFYRPDAGRSREHGGTGLGLSICARIAEAHRGEIWAEASPLGGLALHLRVPTLTGVT